MPHDEQDAFGVLARARANRFAHENEPAQRADAQKVCEAVVKAAENAGYFRGLDKHGNTVIKPEKGLSGAVWIIPGIDGVHIGYEKLNVPETVVPDPAIEYDVTRREWVGKDVDPSVIVGAGTQPPRRSAVAVVAEVVAAALIKIQ